MYKKDNKTSRGTATVGHMLCNYVRYSPVAVDSDTAADDERTRQHEIGHILGMIHEQQRFDRDDYVTFSTGGTDRNNAKIPVLEIFPFGIAITHGTPYDYNSLMHYQLGPGTGVSIINPEHRVRGLQGRDNNLEQYGHLNGGSYLTPWDVYSLRKMYRISDNPRPTYTPGTDVVSFVSYNLNGGPGSTPDTLRHSAGSVVKTPLIML